MGKASFRKGDRCEYKIRDLHRDIGIRSERVPLSGGAHHRGNGADLDVYVRGPEAAPWIGEVKARKDGQGFATIQRWLGDNDFLALIEDRASPLIVLPWERWADLLQELKRARGGA